MSTGIVCGRVLDDAKNPVSCRVVLGEITLSGQELIYRRGMQADGLRLQGRTTRTGCPPYNIAAETDADGTYALIYDFAEDFAGQIAASLRFSVTCYDHNDIQHRFLGSGRGIGIYGLDLRNMLSQCLPLDPAGFGFWTNLIVAAQRAAPSRWERAHTTEGSERRPRHDRGIPLTPHGAPRTTPPGPVPRPPPAQGPQPMQPRGGGAFAQGALGESVGGGRYMLLTKIDVRLGPKGQESARRGPIGGWPR